MTQDNIRSSARRLFYVRPDEIFEHPPGLPTAATEIPEGPIEGYECYSPTWGGDPAAVIGPFDPVVAHEVVGVGSVREERLTFIAAPDGTRRPAEYYYHDGSANEDGRPAVPCWYQSGGTLRFVAKRKPR